MLALVSLLALNDLFDYMDVKIPWSKRLYCSSDSTRLFVLNGLLGMPIK